MDLDTPVRSFTRQPPELEFLYRVRFGYPQAWGIALKGAQGVESQHFFLADGAATGRLSGRFRGANHPRRRTDETFVPDFQGIIETDDGAVVYVEQRGYGRAYPAGRRQIVISATHLSEHERYAWLNDVVCIGIGEVRAEPGKGADLVVDVYEVRWVSVPE